MESTTLVYYNPLFEVILLSESTSWFMNLIESMEDEGTWVLIGKL